MNKYGGYLQETKSIFTSLEYWKMQYENWRELTASREHNERLVDSEVLIYSYLEAGLIEFSGALTTYFAVFCLELSSLRLLNRYKVYTTLFNIHYPGLDLFACKTRYTLPFRRTAFSNKHTWLSILAGGIVAGVIVYTPVTNAIFLTSINLDPIYLLIPMSFGAFLYLYSTIKMMIIRYDKLLLDLQGINVPSNEVFENTSPPKPLDIAHDAHITQGGRLPPTRDEAPPSERVSSVSDQPRTGSSWRLPYTMQRLKEVIPNLQQQNRVIEALGQTFHRAHFFCSHCGKTFGPEDTFQEYEGKAYCEEDFVMLFALKCSACHGSILEESISALGHKWHARCFTCSEPSCNIVLGLDGFYDYENTIRCTLHVGSAKRISKTKDTKSVVENPIVEIAI
ncbi:hypothetical protein BASA81_014065 [Batrachochytrium salamandrivorans]|nr:hypothetical protein BASA81_014065 [Batrachochytrium salamandrivorans]